MVHQHFMLVEVFTVAENLILGREESKAGLLNMNDARRTVRRLSERYGLDVDPDAVIEELPVGVQQRVEILKALANDAKYLILDEPTAVLTPQETDQLMAVMHSLRDEGRRSSSSPINCVRCARSRTKSPSSDMARWSVRRSRPTQSRIWQS